MSEDLVRRLRFAWEYDTPQPSLCDEAADRIEVLEAALRIIAGYDPPIDKMMGDIELARRALEGK